MAKKEQALSRRDPFVALRQLTTELDRFFGESGFPAFRVPFFRSQGEGSTWMPSVDVFEKDGRLITKIDLPGMKKEEVKVEVADGQLVISGERKAETEEKKDQYYRCEREYGRFYRAVPLPDGIELDEVKATFTDGVLVVTVPLPAKADTPTRTVQIEAGAAAVKAA
jgi:HSP20 family protein